MEFMDCRCKDEKRGRKGENWKQSKRLGAKGRLKGRLDWENRVVAKGD